MRASETMKRKYDSEGRTKEKYDNAKGRITKMRAKWRKKEKYEREREGERKGWCGFSTFSE